MLELAHLNGKPDHLDRSLQGFLIDLSPVRYRNSNTGRTHNKYRWAVPPYPPLDLTSCDTHFNEIVQHDLFFLWDECFMLLVDECIRWKTGDHVANKTAPVLLTNIFKLWIRLWGPPKNILTDQEGGLVSAAADTFFDRFRIHRKLVGKDGATSKGLVERHIQLVKLAMLKLKKLLEKDGIDISHSELVQEVCMSQNILLEYGGGSPQSHY